MRNVTMICYFLFLSENLLLKLRNMYKVFLRTCINIITKGMCYNGRKILSFITY